MSRILRNIEPQPFPDDLVERLAQRTIQRASENAQRHIVTHWLESLDPPIAVRSHVSGVLTHEQIGELLEVAS